MRYLKMFGLAALAAALLAFGAVGIASATTIENEANKPLLSGTTITANSEGTTTLHPPIGSIECEESHVGGKTTNAGGAGVNVNVNVEALSWSKCNATVTVLRKGSLSITSVGGSDGVVLGTNHEVTVVFSGFHCIFGTNNTKLGTLTGGAPATLDIEAKIKVIGGSSGVFCGKEAQWTGSYAVSTPNPLNITG